MTTAPLRFLSAPLVALSLFLAACGAPDGPGPGRASPSPREGMVAEVASYELLAGRPNRFIVGLVTQDQLLVSYGTVDMTFSYLGTRETPTAPRPGPWATGRFLPVPGETAGAAREGPVALPASEARGVYAAHDVVFDRAGFWQVQVAAKVRNMGGRKTATAAFEVLARPAVPAPGQAALPSKNPTLETSGVPAAAIDSRAATQGGEVPDPELHRWTIARAISEERPALVVFSTPVYCMSRFCGPVTDVVERLSRRYEDRAVFIHVEIWKDFQEQVIGETAADWLYRNDNLTEPWLFLIGADGIIKERWDNMFTEQEVEKALRRLPVMKS